MDLLDKWRASGPNRVDDVDHLAHGGNQGDAIWLAFASLFLEENSLRQRPAAADSAEGERKA